MFIVWIHGSIISCNLINWLSKLKSLWHRSNFCQIRGASLCQHDCCIPSLSKDTSPIPGWYKKKMRYHVSVRIRDLTSVFTELFGPNISTFASAFFSHFIVFHSLSWSSKCPVPFLLTLALLKMYFWDMLCMICILDVLLCGMGCTIPITVTTNKGSWIKNF